jgi:hypothetical protein
MRELESLKATMRALESLMVAFRARQRAPRLAFSRMVRKPVTGSP